jgi:hypothetical protein
VELIKKRGVIDGFIHNNFGVKSFFAFAGV